MTSPYTRRRFLTVAAGAAALTTVAHLVGRSSGVGEGIVLSGASMGTSYRVSIPRLATDISVEAISRGVRQALERIDAAMSTYRTDSEISRFNRAAPEQWFPVSADTWRVAAAAIAVARLTEGAFDPTIGPLVDLWGFGPTGPAVRMPAPAIIAQKLRQTGYGALEAQREPAALRKRREGLSVDFSGIAEGYAVDEVARALMRSGLAHFLVELGGEIRCHGSNAAGRPWSVAVEPPTLAGARPDRQVELADAAIATSGDYRKFFIANGRRYSHVIDPRTGWPVRHSPSSVSVIGSSAMQCDALATALLVMGREAGLAFAERRDIAALFIARAQAGFSEIMTSSFARYVREGPA
jgi:FAD:protein FMN transferase